MEKPYGVENLYVENEIPEVKALLWVSLSALAQVFQDKSSTTKDVRSLCEEICRRILDFITLYK